MKQKAEAGDATERWNLGTMYDTGEGIPKDYTKALKWFRMAAEQGLAPSQYSVGNMYYNGRGVSKDYAKAAIWYRVSANQGFVLAQYFLGLMYEYGKGVPRNYTKAVQWYRKAANQGLASARYNLGFMYTTGEGVPKDEIEGLAWFYIVAASEQKDAIHNERILEAKLGSRMALLAQQRSKELLKGIAAAKKAKANRSSSNSSSEVAQSSTAKPELKATGSGVIVSANGVILTAAHVVAGADLVRVAIGGKIFPAKVLAIDSQNDLAILQCKGNFPAVPCSSTRSVKLGETVFTIGFPDFQIQGISPKVTKGEINSLDGMRDDPRMWQISVPVQPGNSGGPLFDSAGNLIGIVESKLDAIKVAHLTGDVPQNVNYAVKIDYALPMLESAKLLTAVTPGAKFEDVVGK